MQILEMFHQAGWAAIFSILVALFPLPAGIAYVIRPTEDRLALVRPISLAGIFSSLTGTFLGLMNVLKMMWTQDAQPGVQILSVGVAESLVTLVLGFGALTACWLCVAVGMRRRSHGQ
jgi:hypothetical protein